MTGAVIRASKHTATLSGVAVIGGLDTHKHTHYAAAIDDQGGCSVTSSFRPPTEAIERC
jgi:hypothetical protein